MNTFPDGFLWGATLSAHQTEGGNYQSDWWRWEQRPGRVADGSTSLRAADHYNRYEQDFDLARKLGLNALLLSVAWSRIQPVADAFDDDALDHYAAVFDTLLARGIEPVCVLHDVSRPQWFADAGGWRNGEAPVHFMHYVNRLGEVLGRRCRWWLPLWEPEHCLYMRHVDGSWPGGGTGMRRARQHMARAHVLAYEEIHGLRPDAMVGVSVRAGIARPLDENSPWDVRAAQRVAHRRRHCFLETIAREGGGRPAADFIGVSYYGRQIIRFTPVRLKHQFAAFVDGHGVPAPPWRTQADPAGLRAVLDDMARHELPMVITANGVATDQDGERCAYLLEHLSVLEACIGAGRDVRGYFHRSFLDGFEFERGYRDRYGLVHVDWETLARTPNGSAFLFQDVARNNALRIGALARFCPGWNPKDGPA